MEGNITHTAITSYGYGTLRLKKGHNLPGPIFPILHIFRTIFSLNNYSLRDPLYIRPDFFIFTTSFRDCHSRPTFATPFRDSHSRPHFATPIHDPHSRLPFTPQFRDSRSRLHLRLHFTTCVRDHTRDSRSRLPIALQTATRYICRDFRRATPPLTDGLC